MNNNNNNSSNINLLPPLQRYAMPSGYCQPAPPLGPQQAQQWVPHMQFTQRPQFVQAGQLKRQSSIEMHPTQSQLQPHAQQQQQQQQQQFIQQPQQIQVQQQQQRQFMGQGQLLQPQQMKMVPQKKVLSMSSGGNPGMFSSPSSCEDDYSTLEDSIAKIIRAVTSNTQINGIMEFDRFDSYATSVIDRCEITKMNMIYKFASDDPVKDEENMAAASAANV